MTSQNFDRFKETVDTHFNQAFFDVFKKQKRDIVTTAEFLGFVEEEHITFESFRKAKEEWLSQMVVPPEMFKTDEGMTFRGYFDFGCDFSHYCPKERLRMLRVDV